VLLNVEACNESYCLIMISIEKNPICRQHSSCRSSWKRCRFIHGSH